MTQPRTPSSKLRTRGTVLLKRLHHRAEMYTQLPVYRTLRTRRTILLKSLCRPAEICSPLPAYRTPQHRNIAACLLSDLTL